MKRLVLILMAFCTLLISGTALASDYPKYLGGDPNFILVDAKMGTGWYVDRSSLVVQKYAPPSYAIAVNVCTVPDTDRGSTAISQVKTYRFFYNWNYRSMYVNQDGQWISLDPSGPWSKNGIVLPAGRLAFRLAYNMDFYNTRR